ncbi:two component transcriptional regulator, LuxR family [Sphingomonas sp. NFR04]|uniref:response regulator transcription factor n=1 Tax=Sphingomonas sp. NFR04 TaxID=1566283 RepID=UPI0008DEB30D|nr:response regulator transcription factor [Sphingomonas sp. NFR04]SFJ24659.1 two component transcriptional regulator, LuxR family [Sphingomonas sp. NFR04]
MTRLAPAPEAQPVVLVVDDDPLVRGSLDSLFRSVDFAVRNYGSAQELLDAPLPETPCCLVVDVRMPHMGGFECRDRLAERGVDLPVIFLTGHGDIPMSVKAMKGGAVDFLTKPFRDQDMLDAVNAGLARAAERRTAAQESEGVRQRFATLTAREKQVMEGVVRGLLNKQIAGELGIAEITVKLHRASLMRKMGLRTVPDLVRAAEALPSSDGNA